MSSTPLSWRQHVRSNTVFILAFLNYSLLLLIFFPKYTSRYYFPNYWLLFLVICNFHLPQKSGQTRGTWEACGTVCPWTLWPSGHCSCRNPPKTHHESCFPSQRGQDQREGKRNWVTKQSLFRNHPGEEVGEAFWPLAWWMLPRQQAGCTMNTPPCTWLRPLQNILPKQVPIVWHSQEAWPSPARRCCLESWWCVILLTQYF